MTFPFKNQHRQEGNFLANAGGVKNIFFSWGTYQVEVFEEAVQTTFWPFLQIGDKGELKDSFCTCEVAEKEKSCAHLAAAFLQISGDKPLHVRFQDSFWNHLCFAAFTLFGAESDIWQKKSEEKFSCFSPQHEELISLHVKTEKGQHILNEYIFQRVPETEEISLLASIAANLPGT